MDCIIEGICRVEHRKQRCGEMCCIGTRGAVAIGKHLYSGTTYNKYAFG